MRSGRDGAATIEFDNCRKVCGYAAIFLIPLSEPELSGHTPEEEVRREELGNALSEADVIITELSVVCVEKGVRIRMTREPMGVGSLSLNTSTQ